MLEIHNNIYFQSYLKVVLTGFYGAKYLKNTNYCCVESISVKSVLFHLAELVNTKYMNLWDDSKIHLSFQKLLTMTEWVKIS